MSIEETYRDWHLHWAVRAAVVGLPTEATVERLIGMVCVAYSLQLQLGRRVSQNEEGWRRRVQWTVSDRVSWFWCGQQVIADVGYDWRAWLAQQWAALRVPRPSAPPTVRPSVPVAEAA